MTNTRCGNDQAPELFPSMREWEEFMACTAEIAGRAGGIGDAAERVEWDCFQDRVRARMVKGAGQYRELSFKRPLWELLDEAMQEPEDVAGWCSIMCSRLRTMGHKDLRRGPLMIELASISAEAFALWTRLHFLQELMEDFDEQEARRRRLMAGR